MSDEPVDDVIDETARRLTEATPAGGAEFRRRVLARIESGDAPRRTWRAAFVLSPIAVAAAVVIAVVVSRGTTVRLKPDTTEAATIQPKPETAGPKGAVLQPADTNTAGPKGPALQLATRRPGPFGPGRPGIASPDASALQIAPLDIARLTVDTIRPDPMPIPPLDAITPMTVAPLEITDEQRRYE